MANSPFGNEAMLSLSAVIDGVPDGGEFAVAQHQHSNPHASPVCAAPQGPRHCVDLQSTYL
jgi:hypothetical protein